MSKQEPCEYGHVTFVWDCDHCKLKMQMFIVKLGFRKTVEVSGQ